MNRNEASRQAALPGDTGNGSSFESRPVDMGLPQECSGDAETLSGLQPGPVFSAFSAHRINSEIWRLVLTDKLTGLCNQHGFMALADQLWRMSRRSNREMVFVKFELGNLQQIRDRFERGESDLALMAVAKTLMKTFRRSDVLCRWDGGEFVALAVDGEGLSEPTLKARIQSQARKAAAQISRFSVVLNARLVRVSTRKLGSLEQILACLDRDFADFKRAWFGADAVQPMIVLRDAPQ